jgi:protein SCO1/2
MRRLTMMSWMALALTALLLAGCGRRAPQLFGSVVEPPQPAADFILTDQHGQPFRLSDQRGRIVNLFFGYTHCPDVCPTTLALWRQVELKLGADAEKVRFVFISVDPERDTPERLQEHLALFSPRLIGLTGDPAQLEPIYAAYHVFHEKVPAPESALGYTVSHSSSVYVIDREGLWRMTYRFDANADDVVHDLRELLR